MVESASLAFLSGVILHVGGAGLIHIDHSWLDGSELTLGWVTGPHVCHHAHGRGRLEASSWNWGSITAMAFCQPKQRH